MDHFAATAGSDGTVRCWDYVARKQLFAASHDSPATSLCWVPASLDPQCRTVVVGFADGIVRVLYRASTRWLRVQCFKPHNGSITNLSVSPDGKYLASGCSQGVVFFVHTQELDLGKSQLPYVPAGFVNVGSSVRSLSWRFDSSALLAVSETGQILDIDCSSQLEPSVPGTYRLQVPTKALQISWPDENEVQREDDLSADAVPLGLQRKPTATYATHFLEETIVVAFHDLREIIHSVDQQSASIVESWPVGINAAKPDANVVHMTYETHHSLLVTGSSDGSISTHYVDPESTKPHRCVISQAHDADASVNGISVSHDACFLLSAGSDGLLVVQRIRTDKLKELSGFDGEVDDAHGSEFVMSALVPVGEPLPGIDGFNTILSDVPRDAHDEARESAHSQADDLQSDTYSFEDSRVKSEEDNYRAAAERKKEVVREVLAQMRRDFEDLTRENALQRPENQLQPSDLVLDPDFNHMLEDQGETLLEEVRQACQYDSERSKVLLRKLKDRYLNDLEKQGSNTMEGQSIMALLSRHQVGSFRVPQIAGQLRLLLTQLHATLRNEEQVMPLGDLQSTQGTTTTNGNPALSAGLAGLDVTNGQEHQESKSPTVKESKGVAISTLEARKLMRLNRQSKLAALSLQRPSEDTDDPRDIQAIEHARLHLGDYKLKSGEAYEVPHKQQVNTKRKRRQMLLLQENVNSIKLRYNKRFFALRDVKRLVTHSLIEGTQQLAKLDHTLALLVANTEQLQAGVQQTDLLCNTQFKLVLNEWSDIVRNISHEETRSFTQCQINASKADASQTQWGSSTIAALTTEIDLPVLRLMSRVADHDPDSTYLSNEQCIIHATTLRHKRESIVARMNEHMLAFDNALNELRKEYMPLQADLKAAELRLLILLQVCHT